MSRSCLWDKWVDSHSESAPTHSEYGSIPVNCEFLSELYWLRLGEKPHLSVQRRYWRACPTAESWLFKVMSYWCALFLCVCSMFYACLWSQYLSKTEGSLYCFVLIYAIPKAKARTLLGSQEHWEKCICLPYGSDYVIIRFYIAWVNMSWFKVMFDMSVCYSGYVTFPLISGVMQFTCTDRSMSHALIQWAWYLQFTVWGSGTHCLTHRINSHSQW